jgi:uncharacterized protein (DUF362 family)/ferredoxin
VRKAVETGLDLLGGWSSAFRRGQKVLVKPNLLSPATAEAAVCTHPQVCRALAEIVKDGSASPFVGDGPGLGDARRVASACGLLDALRSLQVPTINLTRTRAVHGEMFKRLELSEEALQADFVLNVAKAKTHGQMVLTLAVKNLFGCVVGTRKAGWHLQAGRDRDWFATLLLDIARVVKPRLNVVDAVVSMDGNGPAAGRPRRTGFICMGEDPVAVDAVVCDILGVGREHVRTVALGIGTGAGLRDPASIRVVGDDPLDLRATGFNLPPLQPVRPRFASVLSRPADAVMGVWPRIARRRCTGCRVCEERCPAGAVRVVRSLAQVNVKECVGCFCCQELCPEGAIGPHLSPTACCVDG